MITKINSCKYSKSHAILVYYLVQQAKNAEIKGAKIMYSNSRRTGTIFQQGVKVKNHLFNISEVSIF